MTETSTKFAERDEWTPEPYTSRLRRWRFPAAIVALLVVAAFVLGIVQSSMNRGSLDPEGIDAEGSRAVARLLEDQGVSISSVRTAGDAVDAVSPRDTVLITVPDLLTSDQIDQVVDTGADLVLVAPNERIDDYAPGLDAVPVDPPDVVDAACSLPAAQRAGAARLGGYGYRGDADAQCYSTDEPTLVVTSTEAGGQVTIIGTGDPLTNEHLDQDGNAALAMGVLGDSDHLVWFRPTPGGSQAEEASFTDRLPSWVQAGTWQLAVAVALAALWRTRRLGRLVTEPLPVVVPAAEATQGRARLYRRARARDHAAATLRAASIRRLDRTAGLRHSAAEPDAVAGLAQTLAERTGWPAERIAALLDGPAPTDDAGLVRLADDLDALEKEARTP